MATQSHAVGQSDNLKNTEPRVNNSPGNGSGAATEESAASSSFTRRATGPRTLQGKERSKFNARKQGFYSKDVISPGESRSEYDALLNGLMEDRQPQGKLEILLVDYLANLTWRRRRILQVETAEIKKAQSVNWDLALQNEVDELEYAQLKGASDAKHGHNNPLLLLRNAIEILRLYRLCYIAGDSQSGDRIRQTLKSIYGYQDGGPEPYGWRQLLLTISKLTLLVEQGKEDSENPPDAKQLVAKAISDEMMRLAKLHDTAAAAEPFRHYNNLAAARVPSQEVSDRLIRIDAHLSREIDKTLTQLEHLQRMRLGHPVPPSIKVNVSSS
jgi:hypothetical protein